MYKMPRTNYELIRYWGMLTGGRDLIEKTKPYIYIYKGDFN